MKKSVTVKAAWIVGICGIVAGSFGLIKCRNENQIDNIVTSHGQSGGITAQNVTTQDITVNNYFDLKSPEEKQALEQTLKVKYPLGYTLFAVDGKTIHIPEGLSFERDFVISWNDSKISKLEPDWIVFNPPQIIYKPTGNAVLGEFNFRLRRKKGFIIPYPMLPSWTKAFLEIIEDKDSFVVVVLGFKE
jgi:hypothetical protein